MEVGLECPQEGDDVRSLETVFLVRKTKQDRRPSQRNPRPPATESLCQLKGWVRTGVCPLGAQVLRTGGRSVTPLSSTKTIQARCFRAFFLPWATPRPPSA